MILCGNLNNRVALLALQKMPIEKHCILNKRLQFSLLKTFFVTKKINSHHPYLDFLYADFTSTLKQLTNRRQLLSNYK